MVRPPSETLMQKVSPKSARSGLVEMPARAVGSNAARMAQILVYGKKINNIRPSQGRGFGEKNDGSGA